MMWHWNNPVPKIYSLYIEESESSLFWNKRLFLSIALTVSDHSEQKTEEKQPQRQKKKSMKSENLFSFWKLELSHINFSKHLLPDST